MTTETITPVTGRDSLLAEADIAANEADRYASTGDPAAQWMETRALRLTIAAALAPPEPNREQKPEIEEGWYLIELMGHRARAGYLRRIPFAGRQLVEITEPEHPADPPHHTGDDNPRMTPARVEFYAPSAIFSITPSTEAGVIKALTDIPF